MHFWTLVLVLCGKRHYYWREIARRTWLVERDPPPPPNGSKPCRWGKVTFCRGTNFTQKPSGLQGISLLLSDKSKKRYIDLDARKWERILSQFWLFMGRRTHGVSALLVVAQFTGLSSCHFSFLVPNMLGLFSFLLRKQMILPPVGKSQL